jgi:UDP-N-acetylmuramoyl-tripeptide--D-alanyl-D-alanine ligase
LKEAVDAAEADLVFGCGPHMQRLFQALPADRKGEWANTSDGIEAALVATVRGGDVVMIKGSLGTGMAPLVEALMRSGEKDCVGADRGA